MSLFGYTLVKTAELESLESLGASIDELQTKLHQSEVSVVVLKAQLESERLTNRRLRLELGDATRDSYAYSEICHIVDLYREAEDEDK